MRALENVMVAVGLMLVAAMATAQTTGKSVVVGEPQYAVAKMTGTVVTVQGNDLLVRMTPSNAYRWFNVRPDREFIIDGQPKMLAQLAPGTMLTATILTKTLPLEVRTTTITKGSVIDVSGRHVSVRLEGGGIRGYTVPESFSFMVDGKPLSVYQLQKGMSITATKIVSEPEAELSALTVITGKAPK